ncbi:MAG: hypothetical protein IPJ69_12600 [Deltaproteobacteria bacterium]|nr:MAG: hypothetical protein IPJ69_12600 [Deltaproteobacteria bacterium]
MTIPATIQTVSPEHLFFNTQLISAVEAVVEEPLSQTQFSQEAFQQLAIRGFKNELACSRFQSKARALVAAHGIPSGLSWSASFFEFLGRRADERGELPAMMQSMLTYLGPALEHYQTIYAYKRGELTDDEIKTRIDSGQLWNPQRESAPSLPIGVRHYGDSGGFVLSLDFDMQKVQDEQHVLDYLKRLSMHPSGLLFKTIIFRKAVPNDQFIRKIFEVTSVSSINIDCIQSEAAKNLNSFFRAIPDDRLTCLTINNVKSLSVQDLANCQFVRGLRELRIVQTRVSVDAIRELSELNWVKLKKLSLNGCQLTVEALEALVNSGMLNGMTELDLSENDFGDVRDECLTSLNCPTLEILVLRACELTDGGCIALGNSSMVRLKKLDINQNPRIGDQGICALVENSKALEDIALGYTQVGRAGVEALSRLTNLKRLHLIGHSKNKSAIAEALGRYEWPQLINLSFAESDLVDEDIENLFRGVFPSLELLYLWNNQISDRGVQAVAQANIRTLIMLDLHLNFIGDAGAIALAGASLPAIQHFNLFHNHIGRIGTRAFARQQWASLRWLHLYQEDYPIDDDDAEILVAGNFENLRHFFMNGSGLTQVGVSCFLESKADSGRMSRLESLSLYSQRTFDPRTKATLVEKAKKLSLELSL